MSKGRTWRNGTLVYTAGGLAVLFLWLMWGDFAYSMKDRATGTVAALMLKKFDVSDFLFGIIMISFPNFTNIFLCPIVSYRSDRHRGRFGRRIPYLLLTTPFIVIGLAGLGFTPLLARLIRQAVGAEHISYNLTALLVFCFFWIILDFGTTLAGAIFNALATDVVPTEFLGRFFAMFRAVSLGCAFLFNYFVMGYAETHALVIFLGLAALYGIGLFSICLKVKEGEYPPPEAETSGPPTVKSAVKTYFRECFSLPYYRWVIMASVVSGFSVVPFNIYGIFYAKSLNMDMDFYGKVSSLICLVSFVLSFFLGWFSDRFHPIRTGMVSMALQTVILFIGGRIATTESVFAWLFLVQGISIMSYNTLMASYAPRLFPREYFAQFNSAMMLINALASVIGAPLVGKFLDLTGNHYPHLFTIGGVIGLCGLGCFVMVYRGYQRYGGDSGYIAPAPTV
ncbi:MFS transporter [Victivallis vadensis]|uniref:MFS transporter n=3 Tax=Victivallis vadensis TaxID=172901 RepID=A0A2U1B491_9BACT|nr:MFS transporter [Victivallis vadensis]NMD85016.1 SLC45 family MFS transporter [Victivallis vadensis]PVY43506.1 MFS transporter [Victivallis vadensis]